MHQLLVVGGGRMGSALLSGLLRSGFVLPEACAIVERLASTRVALEERFPGVVVIEAPEPAESVVFAVKPSDLPGACAALQPHAYERVLSIVAGATLGQIEAALWPGVRVIRAMPNTPALIGTSASAISKGASATDEDLAWAEAVLSSIGIVVSVPEYQLDVATGLSGSGPAYVFLVAEALVEAGVLCGMDRELSRVLTAQTLLGASRLLAESGESAEALRHAVTSPGGTTAAGLRVLEARGVRSAFIEAVAAATERSRELGASEPH